MLRIRIRDRVPIWPLNLGSGMGKKSINTTRYFYRRTALPLKLVYDFVLWLMQIRYGTNIENVTPHWKCTNGYSTIQFTPLSSSTECLDFFFVSGKPPALGEKYTPAETRMEYRTGIEPWPVIQQAGALTIEPRRIPKPPLNTCRQCCGPGSGSIGIILSEPYPLN